MTSVFIGITYTISNALLHVLFVSRCWIHLMLFATDLGLTLFASTSWRTPSLLTRESLPNDLMSRYSYLSDFCSTDLKNSSSLISTTGFWVRNLKQSGCLDVTISLSLHWWLFFSRAFHCGTRLALLLVIVPEQCACLFRRCRALLTILSSLSAFLINITFIGTIQN